MPWSRLRMCCTGSYRSEKKWRKARLPRRPGSAAALLFFLTNNRKIIPYKVGFNASRYTGGDKNEQDNIRNGMRIYTNDRQHNITAGVPFF